MAVIWRPCLAVPGGSPVSPGRDSNWAFGPDANHVKQRDWRSAQDMMSLPTQREDRTFDRILDAVVRPDASW